MRNFLKIAMVLFLLVAMGAATQRPLMGDLEALTTDVTTDYTGIGVPIAAMNGLQTDIDSLESGIMPSMAAESAPASFVTATYTTSLANDTNNDIVWTAVAGSSWGGALGNSIDIIYSSPGKDTESCSVAANTSTGDVNITLSYGSGDVNATALEVMAAVAADPTASLMVVGTNASGNDGSGIVDELESQDLSGGVNGTAGTVGQLYYYSGDLFYLVSGTTFYDATWAQWDGADTDGSIASTRAYTTTNTLTSEQVTSTDDITAADTVYADDADITNNTAIGGTLAVTGVSTFTGDVVGTKHVINIPISASSVDGYAFVSDSNWTVTAIKEIHAVAGNDESPVNVTVTVCDDTEAPASGLPCHNTSIDLKGTAATIQEPTLSGIAANLTIANNDTIGLDFAGTLTNLAGGIITIEVERAA